MGLEQTEGAPPVQSECRDSESVVPLVLCRVTLVTCTTCGSGITRLFLLPAVLGAREKTCIFFNMLTIMSAGLGWGRMITFLELAHMLNATQMV